MVEPEQPDAGGIGDCRSPRRLSQLELGDVPPPSIPDEPSDPAPSDPAGDCHPGYEGACLDPNSIDYDCEGGSGNGPDYTGPVRVVGDDAYDLDRDGNGTACDW